MAPVDAPTYHERTKHSPESLREADFSLDYPNKPTPFKRYLEVGSRPLAPGFRATQQPALAAIAAADPDPLAGTDQPASTPDFETLSQLAYWATGVVEEAGGPTGEVPDEMRSGTDYLDTLFLAASCTGKLYHIDLYLVCGPLDGLGAGVYHVDPPNYALDVVREGDRRDALAAATGGHPGVAEAPVSVVATSTWWRNAWKYRERAFRHAFWDSGTVLANLLAAAHALDLRAEVVTGFADHAVADLVGVDPREEAPLEVVPLGSGTPVHSTDSAGGEDSHSATPPALDPVDHAEAPLSVDPVEYPLIHDAWAAGTLADGDAVRAWRERRGTGPLSRGQPVDGDRVAIDPVAHARAVKTPLPLAIRRRRSTREFDDEPLPFRQFSTILDRATRGVPMDVRDPDDGRLQFVEPYLLVNGVADLPSGAYRYDADADELERLESGDFRETAVRLALGQDWAGTPAVNVYLLADVDAAVDRLGDRGYRVAQLEAGVTLGRFYLATDAHRELGGTGLTFFDDHVTECFAPAAAGLTPMTLYVFGRAGT